MCIRHSILHGFFQVSTTCVKLFPGSKKECFFCSLFFLSCHDLRKANHGQQNGIFLNLIVFFQVSTTWTELTTDRKKECFANPAALPVENDEKMEPILRGASACCVSNVIRKRAQSACWRILRKKKYYSNFETLTFFNKGIFTY